MTSLPPDLATADMESDVVRCRGRLVFIIVCAGCCVKADITAHCRASKNTIIVKFCNEELWSGVVEVYSERGSRVKMAAMVFLFLCGWCLRCRQLSDVSMIFHIFISIK